MFPKYPYLDLSDRNLDFLTKAIHEMENEVKNFVTLNAVKYANPIQWGINRQYEKNTIVIDPLTGTAFISVQPVPSGVSLTRTEYWTPVFDLSQFVTKAASNFANTYERDITTTATMSTGAGDWVVWDSTLYVALNAIHAGDAYVVGGNIKRMTVEDFYDLLMDAIHNLDEELDTEIRNRTNADTTLQHNIDTEASTREFSDTTLQNNIDAEALARENADTTLQNNIDAETLARESADTTLQNNIDAETLARASADVELNRRIDTLSTDLLPLNVTAHGLKGDGVTVNDTAFTALLLSHPNYTYYFPKGTYVFGNATFGGNINLIGDGDAIIVNFNYTDLSFPNTNIESTFDVNQAFFSAKNLKFEGRNNKYGLTIHVQSQGSVLNTFDVNNCTFFGDYGLNIINCITGNICNCTFIKLGVGVLSLSSTNIFLSDNQFLSNIIGLKIHQSDDDTAHRYGGESIILTNCQMIDGVTGILAWRHNYLELVNCMFDYLNMGIYLDSSKFARIVNTYIGYHEGNKENAPHYVAPLNYGCLWAYSSVEHIVSSFECINDEFTAYGDAGHIPVVANGTGAAPVEDIDVIACRFTVISSANCNTILYITYASDVFLDGNRFYAPNNNALTQPFVIDNSSRVINSTPDYANCFNTNSQTILPSAPNRQNNNTYQEAIEVHKTADNSSLISIPVTFNAQYDAAPHVIATIMSGGADYYKCVVSVQNLSRTGCTINIYSPSNNLSGTYYVNLVAMRQMF